MIGTDQTQDDLRDFYLRHFATHPDSSDTTDVHSDSLKATDDADAAEEDDLGYYPDGVKRTLTDDQIAMFRHSEIQALVRARRHRQEAGEPELTSSELQAQIAVDAEVDGDMSDGKKTGGQKRKLGPGKPGGSKKNRRKQKKKKEEQRAEGSVKQEEISNQRRSAREQDVVKPVDMDLDYG